MSDQEFDQVRVPDCVQSRNQNFIKRDVFGKRWSVLYRVGPSFPSKKINRNV